MKQVLVWTDGAARGNPDGPGGYGVLIRFHKANGEAVERELSAGYDHTTNNRMELMGAIAALEYLTEPCDVTITTDSQYIVKAFNDHWIEGWQKNGWRTAKRQPVLNRDLWERLIKETERHQVHWRWVKGHSGNKENEHCDWLATHAADQQSAGHKDCCF